MVQTVVPCSEANWRNVVPWSRLARICAISSVPSFLRAGRPKLTPRLFALLIPNLIRSTRIDLSNDATAPNTVKIIIPAGVEVSIASLTETNLISSLLSVSKTSRRCLTERPNRSIRQTTTRENAPFTASESNRFNAGLESWIPEILSR